MGLLIGLVRAVVWLVIFAFRLLFLLLQAAMNIGRLYNSEVPCANCGRMMTVSMVDSGGCRNCARGGARKNVSQKGSGSRSSATRSSSSRSSGAKSATTTVSCSNCEWKSRAKNASVLGRRHASSTGHRLRSRTGAQTGSRSRSRAAL